MRLCEIREKEVINLCNCQKLGYVLDMEVDLCTGCVEAIIVPVPGSACNLLGSGFYYVIPLSCVCKVGKDVIMVEICEEKCKKKA